MLRQSLSILKQLGSVTKSQDASELLHEDLVMVEQRVEPARKAAQVLHKKLQACMQSQPGLEAERRMKKLPLMMLSTSMAECLKDFDAESSLRRVLEMCCFIEKLLANMLADFEMKVEKGVLEPLNKLSEEDLPEILRNKKQFAKLTTDWNNAKTRSQASTGPQAKQDGLREEVEEAWRKLESIKDQYSADLYHFATKEDNYANYFIRLLELQAEYHKNSHEFLDKTICELKENHNQKGSGLSLSKQKVYGEPLHSHLSQTDREIAAPIQECVHMLLRTGMREEGLFRLAAAASVVKRLKTCLDHGTVDYNEFGMDPHAVAGALKCYLRELPEPLMTFELYGDWFKAAREKDQTEKLEQFKILLKKLPPENYDNLRYLIQFLSLLSEQQSVNKMTPSNIAIVLGPNLLWPQVEGEVALLDMASASSVQVVTIIEPLIQNCSSLFPEAVSFEIPESPVFPDAPAPPSQSFFLEKQKLSRTSSSTSSTASSSSSHHIPLSKTNSTTSQDSIGFLVKSGSISGRSGTTWGTPALETNSISNNLSGLDTIPVTESSEESSSILIQRPTPPPRASVQSSGPRRSLDLGQLEPILEASPNSPTAFVNFPPPSKPKRGFNSPKVNDQVTVQFSKPKGAAAPKLRAPPPPTGNAPVVRPVVSPVTLKAPLALSDANTSPDLELVKLAPGAQPPCIKKPVKKTGVKVPNCPPPLPPPSQRKEIPSVSQ